MSTIAAVTYEGGLAVTPSDTSPLLTRQGVAVPFAGLYTGAGGNITVVTIKGETILFASAAAGIIIPLAITQVKATGTAATGMVAMYAGNYPGRASF